MTNEMIATVHDLGMHMYQDSDATIPIMNVTRFPI